MKQELHIFGDPILREKSKPVETVDDAIRALAKDLIQTMRAERGVGLAAQQIGRTEAICVVEVPVESDLDDQRQRINPDVKMPLVLINPEIIRASKKTASADEGCLSFPGIYAPVRRPVEVTVRFLDLDGQPRELTLRQFIARAVQHEMDHLAGVLLVDRMSAVKRIALAGQLKRMRLETQSALAAAS